MLKRARINEAIRAKEIRLIGADGQQLGIVEPQRGLELAREAGLDLVEVAPQAVPPVCRIMDYSKYRYDQEKKEREAKRRQRIIHLKEIRIGPKIEEHDYQVKLSHLRRFLKRGDKTKITLTFRGREVVHAELGRQILDRFARELSSLSEVEKGPQAEGRRIFMVLAPK